MMVMLKGDVEERGGVRRIAEGGCVYFVGHLTHLAAAVAPACFRVSIRTLRSGSSGVLARHALTSRMAAWYLPRRSRAWERRKRALYLYGDRDVSRC